MVRQRTGFWLVEVTLPRNETGDNVAFDTVCLIFEHTVAAGPLKPTGDVLVDAAS